MYLGVSLVAKEHSILSIFFGFYTAYKADTHYSILPAVILGAMSEFD